MTSFHRRTNRRHIFLSNIINQPLWCRQIPNSMQSTAPDEPSLPLLYHTSSLCFLIFLHNHNLSAFLQQQHTLTSSLNSLWTPNANSVRHLIRHINSISLLIVLIPLSNKFLRDVPLVQLQQKQDEKIKK